MKLWWRGNENLVKRRGGGGGSLLVRIFLGEGMSKLSAGGGPFTILSQQKKPWGREVASSKFYQKGGGSSDFCNKNGEIGKKEGCSKKEGITDTN